MASPCKECQSNLPHTSPRKAQIGKREFHVRGKVYYFSEIKIHLVHSSEKPQWQLNPSTAET
eukprot:2644439-Amphidinium_carterae.3